MIRAGPFRLCAFFDEDALVELSAAIARENSSSKVNRALNVRSQVCGVAAKS